jgi:hypothetical protein
MEAAASDCLGGQRKAESRPLSSVRAGQPPDDLLGFASVQRLTGNQQNCSRRRT